MQRAGHEDKIKGVPGFESWGFRDNQHDKWNVCRPGSILACLKRPFRPRPHLCSRGLTVSDPDDDYDDFQLRSYKNRVQN